LPVRSRQVLDIVTVADHLDLLGRDGRDRACRWRPRCLWAAPWIALPGHRRLVTATL
jgi:hypothetical protein